jgi:hypothetical protein
MDIIYPRVAGLDLHEKMIAAAVRKISAAGKVEGELRIFGTMTHDLLEMLDWLRHACRR